MRHNPSAIAQLQAVIRGIQSGFSSFYALSLEPHGVTFSQFALLLCLAQERPRKMSDIAQLLHVSLPAVTNLVDRLEGKRLIRRQAHPTDRRVTLIDLTAGGLGLVAKTQGKTLQILTASYLHRSVAEQRAILEFMHALHDGLWKSIERDHGRS